MGLVGLSGRVNGVDGLLNGYYGYKSARYIRGTTDQVDQGVLEEQRVRAARRKTIRTSPLRHLKQNSLGLLG